MEYFSAILIGALSSAGFWAIYMAFFQGVANRWLDSKMDRFRQLLELDIKVRELALKSQMEFKERQLSEFYGPIYSLLRRGGPIFKLWQDGRLHEIDSTIRDLFFKANEIISEIILTKPHLVDGNVIPDSFVNFLTHVTIWHGYLKITNDGVPVTPTC